MAERIEVLRVLNGYVVKNVGGDRKPCETWVFNDIADLFLFLGEYLLLEGVLDEGKVGKKAA